MILPDRKIRCSRDAPVIRFGEGTSGTGRRDLELDKMMEVFKKSAPDFYAAYFARGADHRESRGYAREVEATKPPKP